MPKTSRGDLCGVSQHIRAPQQAGPHSGVNRGSSALPRHGHPKRRSHKHAWRPASSSCPLSCSSRSFGVGVPTLRATAPLACCPSLAQPSVRLLPMFLRECSRPRPRKGRVGVDQNNTSGGCEMSRNSQAIRAGGLAASLALGDCGARCGSGLGAGWERTANHVWTTPSLAEVRNGSTRAPNSADCEPNGVADSPNLAETSPSLVRTQPAKEFGTKNTGRAGSEGWTARGDVAAPRFGCTRKQRAAQTCGHTQWRLPNCAGTVEDLRRFQKRSLRIRSGWPVRGFGVCVFSGHRAKWGLLARSSTSIGVAGTPRRGGSRYDIPRSPLSPGLPGLPGQHQGVDIAERFVPFRAL